MNFFENLKPVSADPILGLAAKYREDTQENKVNLTIGVYKNEEGQISLLNSVVEAEKMMISERQNKGYPPIDGEKGFKDSILSLIFKDVDPKHFYVAHSVGATSALHLSGQLLKLVGFETIHFSDLTWPNHPKVFSSCGLNVDTLPYYDPQKHELKIEDICSHLEKTPPRSVLLMQMCCHNPSGRDPSLEEWKRIIEVAKSKGMFIVIDCAYQGFGQGLEEDVAPLKMMMEQLDQFIVCYSCAKNFGLYGERVGAAIIFDKEKTNLDLIGKNARVLIRPNYSTPPIHGARIVKTILESQELKSMWFEEVTEMRSRIKSLRQLLIKGFESHQIEGDYNYILKDQGLFSLLDLKKEQITKLRENYGVYLLENGRINIASLSNKNVDYVCSSLKQTLLGSA